MTGLSINAQSIFIGNPNVGNQAFTDNKAVGLAIPIRLNVYEENGTTYINYFTPSSELGKLLKVAKIKMIGGELDKKNYNVDLNDFKISTSYRMDNFVHPFNF